MGSFAILHGDEDDDFLVEACHLNLWSLSAFLRRVLYFDVGIKIVAQARSVQRFEILLPFDIGVEVQPKGIFGAEDIGDRITNERVGSLVFGESVTVSGRVLSFAPDSSLRVLGVKSFERDETASLELAKGGMSLWKCKLSGRLNPNQVGYVRIRFHPTRGGRTWVWGRSKRTVVVDLRVNEPRETVGHTGLDPIFRDLEKRTVGIEKLNALVIAPSWLENSQASPRLRYVRLFEGVTWEPYLGRAVDLRRSDKLLIYHWRALHIRSDGTKPFRGFLAFRVEPRWPAWFAPVATAVAAAVLVLAGLGVGTTLPTIVLPAVSVGALVFGIGVIERLRSNASLLLALPGVIKRGFMRAEHVIYRLLAAQ
jgi:hypothetical protein